MARFLFSVAISVISFAATAQKPINWTAKQLMQPAELAKAIKLKQNVPAILSIGPGATIPNSVAIGPISDEGGFQKFVDALQKVPKDKKVVVYCGCCPFENCPNVRPAIAALKQLQFTDYYLLNLEHNVKTDWIDKGYPVAQ